MRLFSAAAVAALLVSAPAHAQTAPAASDPQDRTAATPSPKPSAVADPFIWLEDVDGARAMTWVKAQNVKSGKRLEGDPRFEPFRKQALAILTATDRIPMPTFRAGGVDNFWQDESHVKGVWRHATLASYRTASPEWKTLIDFDALSKAEGKNWIFKGAECLKPAQTICLVRISDGGTDAVEIREFDTAAGKFIPGGFQFSTGKQYVEWLDRDTLIVGRDWAGDGSSLTDSGYPFVLKVVKRGQGLDAAREVYRGRKADVWAQPIVLRGDGGRVDALIAQRGLSFYESEYYLLGDGQPVRLPWPGKATVQGYVDGQVAFTIQEDWNGFKEGDLLAYDLAELKAHPAAAKPVLITRPGPTQAIEAVAATKNRLVVELLENVKGAVDVYAHGKGGWTHARLDLPKDAAISVRDTSDEDDRLFLTSEGFLTPTSLWAADAAAGRTEQIKALPARFRADDVVEQFWATSSDGAKIPYFVVRPKAAKLDGSTPTIMYGYGGFQLSKPPAYIPEMGKLWLERGGAYVIANIRGGGEFGPRWHQSVLREHRQLAFDDFAAVARDLTKRGISSPRRLGIYGRSNGGVLMSVSMTQHPELYNAVVIESPLIDMLRYHKLSAGASWVGEYGNPDVAADYAFIARYSGYQNLKPGVKYPEPYITTNTKDDRVHPGHARKFAAKMEALGAPYLYYEQTFGGHANDADPELNAGRWARHYVYLTQKLMD
jgi:prolyl oligopeptidase